MSKSCVQETGDEPEIVLPPVICLNPRVKLEPQEISVTLLITPVKGKPRKEKSLVVSQWIIEEPPHPVPRQPLAVAWWPKSLCFHLNTEKIVQRLKVWNTTSHTIYVQCCGLWNDSARLGASWQSYPRGRFRLAPGLMARIFISSAPREFPSPVPLAYVGLQLALTPGTSSPAISWYQFKLFTEATYLHLCVKVKVVHKLKDPRKERETSTEKKEINAKM